MTYRQLLRSRMAMLHSSTFLFRRKALGEIGLVSEEVPGSMCEDWDVLLRAARRHDVLHVDEPLVTVLWGSTSFFASRWETKLAAHEWMLRNHPDVLRDRVGGARVLGQMAFSHAALGHRARALRTAWATVRRNPLEPRAPLAVAVAMGLREQRPASSPCSIAAGTASDGHAPSRLRAWARPRERVLVGRPPAAARPHGGASAEVAPLGAVRRLPARVGPGVRAAGPAPHHRGSGALAAAYGRALLVPRGAGLWFAFLLWVVVGVATLDLLAPGHDRRRWCGSDDRLRLPLRHVPLGDRAAGLPVLHDRVGVPARLVVRSLGWLFVAAVVGGYLGLLLPSGGFTSPFELVLPGALLSNGFVHDLVHPYFAQVQDVLGVGDAATERPVHLYQRVGLPVGTCCPPSSWTASSWGRRAERVWGAALLAVSVVPVVLSLNRGLWFSLAARRRDRIGRWWSSAALG